MKRWVKFGAAVVLALAMCAVSAALLLACMRPMEDRAYDLAMHWRTEARPEGWVYDQ